MLLTFADCTDAQSKGNSTLESENTTIPNNNQAQNTITSQITDKSNNSLPNNPAIHATDSIDECQNDDESQMKVKERPITLAGPRGLAHAIAGMRHFLKRYVRKIWNLEFG